MDKIESNMSLQHYVQNSKKHLIMKQQIQSHLSYTPHKPLYTLPFSVTN